MKTKELNEIHYALTGKPKHKKAPLIYKNLPKGEGSKNEMLKDLRVKLGKSKEQFSRIFELYNQLTKYKNL